MVVEEDPVVEENIVVVVVGSVVVVVGGVVVVVDGGWVSAINVNEYNNIVIYTKYSESRYWSYLSESNQNQFYYYSNFYW